ncbi:MAG: putative FmdB family regulatory protein [Saprospiraceae bacterium]|jgi:putative FmdB family regulatory protein
MPIYEYVCTECNHELETIQKMSDDALVFCPECSNETLKKKISAAAFKLKGTGWYETDFKTKPKDNGSSDDSSKADSKPAASKDKPPSSDKAKAKSSEKKASAA